MTGRSEETGRHRPSDEDDGRQERSADSTAVQPRTDAPMSLSTTPEYDGGRVPRRGEHAVVVGGSMAGLLTARVLADAFERVTIVERDEFPDEPTVRRGVPQGRHVHALQTAGRATLEDLFPGFGRDLLAAGAEEIDVATDFRFFDEGDFVAEGPDPLPMYCASRPLFEAVTLERVRNVDGIELREGKQVTAVRHDDAAGRVEGVTVRDGDATETVPADLVVDATGRTSRAPTWLADWGYRAPPEDEVDVDLAYGTVYLDRPSGDDRALYVMPDPPSGRGAVVLPVEGDRWVVTLFGLHGDHPPTDPAGFLDFAASLPIDEVAELVRAHRTVSDGVAGYPFPASRRRRYWALDRFPDGFLVVGDAVASFNPIYGQGMSVAALEARHLHRVLVDRPVDGLAPHFFDRIEPVVEDAWRLSVGSDFRFPDTAGPKPLGTDVLNRYVARLTRQAHEDGLLADAYARVVAMERPPQSLLRPRFAWRVLRPAVGPWGHSNLEGRSVAESDDAD